jgi:hypothetical protein
MSGTLKSHRADAERDRDPEHRRMDALSRVTVLMDGGPLQRPDAERSDPAESQLGRIVMNKHG